MLAGSMSIRLKSRVPEFSKKEGKMDLNTACQRGQKFKSSPLKWSAVASRERVAINLDSPRTILEI